MMKSQDCKWQTVNLSALVEKREGRRFWVLLRRVEGRRETSVCCQKLPLPPGALSPQPQTASHPVPLLCSLTAAEDCLKPNRLGLPGLPSSGSVGTVSLLARLVRMEDWNLAFLLR